MMDVNDCGSPVNLYIYDISQGLARSMSQMLLGKHIDGIWHTAVVVFGQEYFYGSGGIASCDPGGTILNQPQTILKMGTTFIPHDVFLEYLQELSTSQFHGIKYHLFDHNCNTFSAEVVKFLTDKTIPSYITSLPQEVLQTPFGAMLKPFVDQMSSEISSAPGHTITHVESYQNNRSIPFSDAPKTAPNIHNSITNLKDDVTVKSNIAHMGKSQSINELCSITFKESNTHIILPDDGCADHFKDSTVFYDLQKFVQGCDGGGVNWGLGPSHFKLLDSFPCGTSSDKNMSFTSSDFLLLDLFRRALLNTSQCIVTPLLQRRHLYHFISKLVMRLHSDHTVTSSHNWLQFVTVCNQFLCNVLSVMKNNHDSMLDIAANIMNEFYTQLMAYVSNVLPADFFSNIRTSTCNNSKMELTTRLSFMESFISLHLNLALLGFEDNDVRLQLGSCLLDIIVESRVQDMIKVLGTDKDMMDYDSILTRISVNLLRCLYLHVSVNEQLLMLARVYNLQNYLSILQTDAELHDLITQLLI